MIRLTIREVADTLKYKSTKSAHRWCGNNQVKVFSDLGTRRKYVLKTDFDLARLHVTISHVKRTYGESHWRTALKAYLNDNMLDLIVIKQGTKSESESQAKKGKHEKKFLTELNSALSRTN